MHPAFYVISTLIAIAVLIGIAAVWVEDDGFRDIALKAVVSDLIFLGGVFVWLLAVKVFGG